MSLDSHDDEIESQQLAAKSASTQPRSSETLWAITAYFDPLGTQNRLGAYREFRRHLQVPLVAVELSYSGAFDLGPDDAEIVVRLRAERSESLIWQKERLLNVALKSLPAHCDTVAWVDSDVVLLRPDWPIEARRLLDGFPLLQPFSRLYYLNRPYVPDTLTDAERASVFNSVGFCRTHEDIPAEAFRIPGSSRRFKYAPGMAWVARRDLLEHCGGLYDAAVMGGADKLMFSAACGHYEDSVHSAHMNPGEAEHYRAWAQRFHDSVRGRISYVEGDLLHLWHNEIGNRLYARRYNGFERYGFDPSTDLEQTPEGVWRWNSNKPELHSRVRMYFEHLEGEPVTWDSSGA